MRTSESSNCDGERASERDGEGGLPRVRGTPGGAGGGGGREERREPRMAAK